MLTVINILIFIGICVVSFFNYITFCNCKDILYNVEYIKYNQDILSHLNYKERLALYLMFVKMNGGFMKSDFASLLCIDPVTKADLSITEYEQLQKEKDQS